MHYPRLRDLREDHDMTQDELVAKLGMHKTTYTNYEQGKREIPSFAADDEMLADKNVNMIRRTFPGGHDWSVWRRCIHDFLPMIFRD